MQADGPVQWTATLRDEGRLVLRPLRGRLSLMLFVAAGILLVNGTRTVGVLSGGGTWGWIEVFRALLAVFAAGALVVLLNNVRTGRWTVVVDEDGVAVGRRRLPWAEIANVRSTKDQVTVNPYSGEELRVTNYTVTDPTAFGDWLKRQLADRR
jgi:acyl-CoA synthetase (AMP-forming)/AMP-acid ligase II